jgi:DNA-binding GntR family transcriptional regulator
MTPQTVEVELYVLDSLMADLVGHDRRPSAYILYLALLRLGLPSGAVGISLQGLATATGLSKTAVQRSVSHLARRGLVAIERAGPTEAPRYRVLQPWRR